MRKYSTEGNDDLLRRGRPHGVIPQTHKEKGDYQGTGDNHPVYDDPQPLTPLDPQNGTGTYSDNEQSEAPSGDHEDSVISNTRLPSTGSYERESPIIEDWFPLPEYELGDSGVITHVTHSDFDGTYTITVSWSGGGTQQVVIAEDEYLDRVSNGENLEVGAMINIPGTDTTNPDYPGPEPDPELVIPNDEIEVDVTQYDDGGSGSDDDPPSEPEYTPGEGLDHNPYLD